MSFITHPYVAMLHPQKWIKNIVVFAPLFLGGKLFDISAIGATSFNFILFCLAASGLSILNDYKEIAFAKNRSAKSAKPLATGKIESDNAFLLAFFLLSISMMLAYTISPLNTKILFAYILLNIGYSYGLRKIIVLDILLLAAGFVLIVFAGGISAATEISYWIYLLAFLLALLIILGKRYNEATITSNADEVALDSVSLYAKTYVQYAMLVMAVSIVIVYLLYVTSAEVYSQYQNYYLAYSTLFVAIGLARFLQLILIFKKNENPIPLLYSDRVLQIAILAWIANYAICIYWT